MTKRSHKEVQDLLAIFHCLRDAQCIFESSIFGQGVILNRRIFVIATIKYFCIRD